MKNSFFPMCSFLVVFMSGAVLWQPAEVRSQEQNAPTLSSLKFEFDVRRAELMKPVRDLRKKYKEQLHQLMTQVTESGDLEKVLAVKAELVGFKNGNSKLPEKFPELKQLQGIYAKTYPKRIALMNGKLRPVIEDHQEKLLALQTRLTKEEKVDEALLVKAEIAKVDELAKPGQELMASGNLSGTAGATPVLVAKSVQAKKGAEEPAENVIAFDAPNGDGRSGAKGILVKSDGGAEEGSTWMFGYTRTGSAFEMQIIHPRGKGQAIIHLRPDGISISTPGDWRSAGYGGGDTSDIRTKDAFEEIFPLEDDREYAITSRMDHNGSCEFFVDGKLVATARARSAKPLGLEIPEDTSFPGASSWAELEFKGDGLPMKWEEHWAGILLGPLDGGTHRCSEVRYSVGIAAIP